jgi:hypothetical protein
MAVELTKVALWIETVEPGKPLGFLDGNIRCGDSLLGVFDLAALDAGIPDGAYKTLTGDDSSACRELLLRNRDARDGQGTLDVVTAACGTTAAPLAREEAAWRALPENSLEQIAAKRARQEAARADAGSYALGVACDLYVAAFLAPKPDDSAGTPGACLVPTTADVWRRRDGGQVYPPREGYAVDLSREARAFHWPLEFPVAIARGGFDVVLGNPPWEVVQLGEEEYFAQRLPEIAELTGAERKRAIALLERSRPTLFSEYVKDKRQSEAENEFVRDSLRFKLTARGKVNTFGLFAELFVNIVRENGRAGIIVPTGIATDATTAPFFASLIAQRRLVNLYDFQTGLGFFDRIGHARFKFCLLTIAQKGSGPIRPALSFFSRTIQEFHDKRRHFTLSAQEIANLNPNTLTAPVFRTGHDADLTARIYSRVPVLLKESSGQTINPWGIAFRQGLFNMTSDSKFFRTAKQLSNEGLIRDGTAWIRPNAIRPAQSVMALAGGHDDCSLRLEGGGPAREERWVPLYEAKMIHQFDHRWATYNGIDARDTTVDEKSDPTFEPDFRYWVPEQ